jgi:UDP-N-acetylglucosamine 4,6-dehydratase/5-epimerase
VQQAPAATIEVLVKVLLDTLSAPKHAANITGTRHSEKLFEVLCGREEMFVAQNQGKYCRMPTDNRNLNYAQYAEEG